MTWDEAEVGMTIWETNYSEARAMVILEKSAKTIRGAGPQGQWRARIISAQIKNWYIKESEAWAEVTRVLEAKEKWAILDVDKARASLAACLEREREGSE